MPYQGNAGSTGSDSGGSVGVVMPAEAPPDLGTGAGGLMQIGQTQVVGQSGTAGANLPVDALEQASSMIVSGKADLNQTAGAEHRLDGFDGATGTAADGTTPPAENVSSSGMGNDASTGQKVSTGTPSTGTPGTDQPADVQPSSQPIVDTDA
jgi:hypothetical protein